MSTITRGDPPTLKNVRRTVYHHYLRVDNPKSLIFLSGQLARDADGKLVTGAGVSAGLDLGLSVVARLRDKPYAQGRLFCASAAS